MQRILTLLIIFCAVGLHAQKKSPANKPEAVIDSSQVSTKEPTDTLDPIEAKVKASKKFAVYNKRNSGKVDKQKKYCIQLVSDSTIHTYCSMDSTIKNPEVTKILFNKQVGDTNYVLVFIDGFTKVVDKIECEAGKETKLVFFRWNTRTNKSIVKIRTINSCLKAITNMTKENIADWDGVSVLTFNYHRGGVKFVEVKFDPAQCLLGFQSTDTEK